MTRTYKQVDVKMKKTRTQIIGQWALDNGYEVVASIIRSHFNTSYWNINNSARGLAEGRKWIRSNRGLNYTIGERTSQIDWSKTISRTEARYFAERDGYFETNFND